MHAYMHPHAFVIRTIVRCLACCEHNRLMYGVLPWQQPTHVWRVTTSTTNSCLACYHDNNRLMYGVLPRQQPTRVWRVTMTATDSCHVLP